MSVQFSREWEESPAPDDEVMSLDPWVAKVDTRDDGGCAVEIRGNNYDKVTDTHNEWMEQTTVILYSEDDSVAPESLCSGVKVLAAAVAKRLPTG